jgi:DNA polymerase III subunit delta
MAANPIKTLRDAIKRQQFDGVYYIYGDDEFQKNDAIQQFLHATVDPATRDFNLEVRRGGDVNAEILESLVGTPPMMADRRVVVIRDVNILRKDARILLDSYVQRPSPDTILLLVAAAGAKGDKTLQQSTTPLEFTPLEDSRVPKWIAHYVSDKLATEITSEAADLLHSAVGNDLYQIAAELDKLVSYTNGAIITESAVSDVVGIRRGETIGDLLDAVLERDAKLALELVQHILMQPKTTAVSVVMALSTQMLALAWGRARLNDGLSQGRLESEFFSLLKSTGAFPMRPWGGAAKAWVLAVPQWSTSACDCAIETLLLADIALKETRVSSEDQILATVVLALCGGDTCQRRAA